MEWSQGMPYVSAIPTFHSMGMSSSVEYYAMYLLMPSLSSAECEEDG